MQTDESINSRLMPDILRTICNDRGIALAAFCDDWVLELSCGAQRAYVIGYKFSINDAAAAGIAQDKVATYELLKYRAISAVEHRLIRPKAGTADWQNWLWNRGMVIKPLTGSSGQGVRIVHDTDEARRWMDMHGMEVWAVAPLLDILREIRVILLDGQVLLSYEKVPVLEDGLKVFNLSKGATPKNIKLSPDMEILAKNALQAVGLRLASVDIVELPGGSFQVLEINDGIMMERYARMSASHKAKARLLYGAVVDVMFDK